MILYSFLLNKTNALKFPFISHLSTKGRINLARKSFIENRISQDTVLREVVRRLVRSTERSVGRDRPALDRISVMVHEVALGAGVK